MKSRENHSVGSNTITDILKYINQAATFCKSKCYSVNEEQNAPMPRGKLQWKLNLKTFMDTIMM
jgi:hypothetical protein